MRQRVLRAFQRRGWIERAERIEIENWHYGGGFSLDASVGIAGGDLLPKPWPYWRAVLILSAPEFFVRIASLYLAVTVLVAKPTLLPTGRESARLTDQA